jgi:hypothetical protein
MTVGAVQWASAQRCIFENMTENCGANVADIVAILRSLAPPIISRCDCKAVTKGGTVLSLEQAKPQEEGAVCRSQF